LDLAENENLFSAKCSNKNRDLAENKFIRDCVKNNLPILIGFYPILNAITLSGFSGN
jgi:hypothetical protein